MANLFGRELAAELTEKILEFAAGGRLVEGVFPDPSPTGEVAGPVPAKWRLISREWNRCITPYVYSKFSFHGNPTSILKLWKFLHIIVTRPERAALVKHMTLTTMDLHKLFDPTNIRDVLLFTWKHGDRYVRQGQDYPRTDSQILDWLDFQYLEQDGTVKSRYRRQIRDWYFRALYRSNRGWIAQALSNAGFDQKLDHNLVNLKIRAEKCLHRGHAQDGYQCPLFALLLAYCPNLRGLTFHLWTPETDPWFDTVLGYGIRGNVKGLRLEEAPLQKLRKLYVTTRMYRLNGAVERWDPFIMDDEVRPFYRLPQLTEFMAYDLKCAPSVSQITDQTLTPRRIEKLTLQGRIISEIALPTLLSLTPNLRQFSLSITEIYTDDLGNLLENNGPEFYQDLWKMLLPFREQLEYLDLYQEKIHLRDFRRWYDPNKTKLPPFCPPFAQFTALRQLNIPLTLLAGHKCYHQNPSKFRSHLPPNVESLGLYTEDVDVLDQYIDPEHWGDELRGIVAEGTRVPNGRLRCLVVGCYFNNRLPVNLMKQDALHHGLYWREKTFKWLFQGGEQTLLTRSVEGAANETRLRLRARRDHQGEVIPRGMVVHGVPGGDPPDQNDLDEQGIYPAAPRFVDDSDDDVDSDEDSNDNNNGDGDDNNNTNALNTEGHDNAAMDIEE